MKYYNFLQGFIIVTILILLLAAKTLFNINVPLIKNIKHPAITLLILGFLLCAFGTTGHSMLHLFKTGFNLYTVLLILLGLCIVIFAILRFWLKVPVFGINTNLATFIVLISLIGTKILIATLRIITFQTSGM